MQPVRVETQRGILYAGVQEVALFCVLWYFIAIKNEIFFGKIHRSNKNFKTLNE